MATPQGQDDAKAKKSKFQKADASILGFMGYKEEKASGGGKGKGGKGKGEGGEKGDSGGKGKKGQSKGDRKGGKGGKKGDRPKDPGEEQAAVPLPLAAPEQGAPQAQRRKDNWVPGMPPARESSQLKAQPKPKAAPVDASLTPAEMPPPGSPSAMPGAGSMPVNGALQPPRNNGGRYVPPNLRNKQGGKAEGPLSPNGQGLLFDRTSNGSSPFPGGMPPPPMPQQPLGRGPAMPPAAPTQPWQDGGMVPPPMGPPPMRPQVSDAALRFYGVARWLSWWLWCPGLWPRRRAWPNQSGGACGQSDPGTAASRPLLFAEQSLRGPVPAEADATRWLCSYL
eukprot:TRINITY_DN13434_c0_g1_i17.p1 TRINITY_DN13434_c0_g1~~TRINITY_DN13434_c0_g1_i17.p1  ORF type:complete len:337 (-),score=45.41 TRINITY_DN13434_c0_g1_i17:349-1359(-)